jgi:hypothetical protein
MRAATLSQRPFKAGARPFSAGRRLVVKVRAESVLIVNTKGGGHAFIGLHLAKQLADQGHEVTILNDGDEVRTHCGPSMP